MNAFSQPARVAVIGLGGIGLGLAAALAESGNASVIGCARRRMPRATIERAGSIVAIDMPIVDDPKSVEPVDWVVFATKVYQSEGAAAWLDALVDERTRILVAQNGIERDRAIAGLAPRARAVVPSVIYFNGRADGNGHVVFVSVREVDLIVPQTQDAADFESLLAPFFHCAQDAAYDGAAWRKLMLNVAANCLTALTLSSTDVIHKPSIRELALRLMTEAGAVARASGVALPESVEREMLDVLLAYPPGVATSMYRDRLEGRPTEIDAFNGTIVDLARRYGIDVPANEVVTALMRGIGG